MKSILLTSVIACALAVPATAATYTYDVNYTFPILRDGLLGGPAKPRAGSGSVSGTFTIDDTFDTTRQVLSYNFTSFNTTTGFTQQNSYSYSNSDVNDTLVVREALSHWDPAMTFNISNGSSAISCAAGLIAPSGQHSGRTYGVSASGLTLYINKNFKAGDANFSMLGRETFGTAPLCASRGYADLGFEHTAPNNGFVLAGVLAPATTPVPLPAGLPLLLAGIGGLAWMRRRQAAS